MSQLYDVAIIGGGLSGLALSIELAQAGQQHWAFEVFLDDRAIGEQRYVERGPDGALVRTLVLPMAFDLIGRDEVDRHAAEAGFVCEHLFGGYDESAFDPAGSPHMIFVFRPCG